MPYRTREENNRLYALMKEQIRIVDYAEEIGFTVQRVGNTGYFTLKEHDSIRIKPNNSFVRYADDSQKGSVIDFALAFTNKSKHEILKDFTGRVQDEFDFQQKSPKAYEQFKQTQVQKDLPVKEVEYHVPDKMPLKGENMRNVYAYLLKSRFIHQNIVQDMVDRKQLYQDDKRNCVFVGYDLKEDSKVVFASWRGTHTEKRFVGDVSGCDYQQGLLINNNAKHLFIAESSIDALSKMTLLHLQGKNYKDYDYLILSGTEKYQACTPHLQSEKYQEVTIATDNDAGGISCAEDIKRLIEQNGFAVEVHTDLPKVGKDWNEELKFVVSKGYRKDYTIPTEQQKEIAAACVSSYLKNIAQDKTPRTLAGRAEYLQNQKSNRTELLQYYGLPAELDQYIEVFGRENKIMNPEKIERKAIDNIFDKYNKKSIDTSKNLQRKTDKQIER